MAVDPQKNSLAVKLVGGSDSEGVPSAPSAPTVQPQKLNGNADAQSAAPGAAQTNATAAPPLLPPPGAASTSSAAKPNPKFKSKVWPVVYDKKYWDNVMALNAQYGNAIEGINIQGQQNWNHYRRSTEQTDRDRRRSRRDLAESLLGRGNVYGGAHRRENVERDEDYVTNRGALDEAYTTRTQELINRRAEIEAELSPLGGSAWMEAEQDLDDRIQAGLLETANTAAPDPIKGRNEKIKGLNKRIRTLRARVEEVEDPERRKKIRAKIQAARKKRDKLKQKGTK